VKNTENIYLKYIASVHRCMGEKFQIEGQKGWFSLVILCLPEVIISLCTILK